MPDNSEVVRQFVQLFLGRADLGAAERCAHPAIQGITGLKPMGAIDGLDEYKEIVSGFVDAFPSESPLEIIDQFSSADGDRVVTRFHSRRRHAKAFFGVPATQRVILFDETHVARLKDGLIVENILSATNLEFEMLMAPVLTPMILKYATPMKAIRVHEFGNPGGIRFDKIPAPPSGKDQVLVHVRAAGLNPIDWKIADGVFPRPLPVTLGQDFAGVIESVADGSPWLPGDAVFGMLPTDVAGSYAEALIIDAGWIAREPQSLSFCN